jgi:hypothetical protein
MWKRKYQISLNRRRLTLSRFFVQQEKSIDMRRNIHNKNEK